ncbi:hypothetical protein GCM10010401_07040 [Rarobacter faecitabidus]|uniref:Uncharacterized protein n=1 Tax=Rarobacter faecitabidus TaxID=13243 RepID=A0A542ZT62_RARFA|nr:hypothetical protein [Rarobacter faecitabidus]TQL63548.1 hypothetical protein FB461_0007 [Rarobacter faecitabidus]
MTALTEKIAREHVLFLDEHGVPRWCSCDPITPETKSSYVRSVTALSAHLIEVAVAAVRAEATRDVNRVEVIDSTGRAYIADPRIGDGVSDVQIHLQDEERTLKVFLTGSGRPTTVTPSREDVDKVLREHQWSAALGGCFGGECEWDGGHAEDEQEKHAAHVTDALMHLISPLLPGRSEAEVRTDERERIVRDLRAKFGVTNRAADHLARADQIEKEADRG